MDVDKNTQTPDSPNTEQTRKPWTTPVLTAVSIADLTESMLNTGSDGLGSSTLS